MSTSPFIAAIFGVRDARGRAQKSGYFFALYLRDANGRWLRERVTANGATPPAVAAAANGQESRWLCYAWPTARGQSGHRAFVVNQVGDVCATANTGPGQQYSGTTRVPRPGAALAPNGRTIALAGTGLTASDGGTWVPAGN